MILAVHGQKEGQEVNFEQAVEEQRQQGFICECKVLYLLWAGMALDNLQRLRFNSPWY